MDHPRHERASEHQVAGKADRPGPYHETALLQIMDLGENTAESRGPMVEGQTAKAEGEH